MRRVKLRLATSRYAAGELIVASGLAAVRTSLGGPRFKVPYEIAGVAKLLMPAREMLKLDEAEYRALYMESLDVRGVDAIRAELEGIAAAAGRPGLVLLCFEDLSKPGLWCHRRMAAEWLEEQTGQAVEELAGDATAKPRRTKEKPAQGELF